MPDVTEWRFEEHRFGIYRAILNFKPLLLYWVEMDRDREKHDSTHLFFQNQSSQTNHFSPQ